MGTAVLALDRVVGICGWRKSQFCGRASMSTATPGVHSCNRPGIIGEHEIACVRNSPCSGAPGRGWFAEKLAMRRIAEIDIGMTPAASDEVGPSGNSLGLQSFERGVRRVLRRDH